VQSVRENDIPLIDQLDMKFHVKLIEISGNDYLKMMINQFHLLIRSFQISRRLQHPGGPAIYPGHAEIIEALERRDKRTCLQLIGRHINGARRALVNQVSG
jgi:DNA-binding GntR family transcriptional regulator